MNKNRIGILTMHRVQNYGSALQAYALQEHINRLGYEAELIDYIFPNGKHKQRRPLKKVIKSTLFKWAFALPLLRKSKRFARFYAEYYKCSELQFDNPQSLMQYDYAMKRVLLPGKIDWFLCDSGETKLEGNFVL